MHLGDRASGEEGVEEGGEGALRRPSAHFHTRTPNMSTPARRVQVYRGHLAVADEVRDVHVRPD